MKFIAHRGYSACYPENSLPAFEAVINHPQNGQSLIGIELDVQLTADGLIPIMHETTIRDVHTTPLPVGSITMERLQQWHREKHGDSAPAIPELSEVFQLISHNTGLWLEIKEGEYDFDCFCKKFISLLERYQPCNDVALSSFSVDILRTVIEKTAHLDLTYAFIFEEWDTWKTLPGDVYDRIQYIHPDYHLIMAEPERIPEFGRPLYCWAVNDPRHIQTLLHMPHHTHIEAIMTDIIEYSTQFSG